MRKINGAQVCYVLSALWTIAFVISTIVDYHRYNSTFNSAPFSIWIAVNGLCFIVPAVISLIIGIILQKKACQT